MTTSAKRPLFDAMPAVTQIALGGAAYGFAVGAWNAPQLGLYVSVKLPLLLFLTAAIDAFANWLLARGLGAELRFGSALESVLRSFGTLSLILAGLAPIFLVFDWTLPESASAQASTVHHALGLVHVAVIALAGVMAVRRQAGSLQLTLGPRLAKRITVIWLALNLLVGAQLSWNLRPWFGSPGSPVEWLRPDPFDGTFYESVFRMLAYLFVGQGG